MPGRVSAAPRWLAGTGRGGGTPRLAGSGDLLWRPWHGGRRRTRGGAIAGGGEPGLSWWPAHAVAGHAGEPAVADGLTTVVHLSGRHRRLRASR